MAISVSFLVPEPKKSIGISPEKQLIMKTY
jgi:hypothetical protein